MSSPMQRSLALLRDEGWYCEPVEHWVPKAHIRRDLLGFADILCLAVDRPALLVQTTTSTNQAARKRKVLASPYLSLWLGTGGRVVVHGWGLAGRRGERKVWTLTACEITKEMLAA